MKSIVFSLIINFMHDFNILDKLLLCHLYNNTKYRFFYIDLKEKNLRVKSYLSRCKCYNNV